MRSCSWQNCVGVSVYFPAPTAVINLSYTLNDSCPSSTSFSFTPAAAISSASPSAYWSLTLCHHKTMQLCAEGKLKKGRAALCIQCDLRRGYSLLIQDASGVWNERLPSIHCSKTMKQKENERKTFLREGLHRRLRHTGRSSTFKGLLWALHRLWDCTKYFWMKL